MILIFCCHFFKPFHFSLPNFPVSQFSVAHFYPVAAFSFARFHLLLLPLPFLPFTEVSAAQLLCSTRLLCNYIGPRKTPLVLVDSSWDLIMNVHLG